MNESPCNQCGECCRIKVQAYGRKIALNIYCPALDLDTKRCMMYEWRHTAKGRALRGGSRCHRTWYGLWLGLFPKSCAYRRWWHRGWVYDKSKLGLVPWRVWADTLVVTSRMRKRIKDAVR